MDFLTTSNCSSIVKKQFYNKPLTGNIIYSNGDTLLDDLLINNKDEVVDNNKYLSTKNNHMILTKDNKKIILNV